MRRHHKILGLILIVTGLLHGLFSSEKVWTLNLGTIAWVLSVLLLGLNWLFKKELPVRKGWMYYHRALTVAFTVILLMHVANVGVQGAADPIGLPEPIDIVGPAGIRRYTWQYHERHVRNCVPAPRSSTLAATTLRRYARNLTVSR